MDPIDSCEDKMLLSLREEQRVLAKRCLLVDDLPWEDVPPTDSSFPVSPTLKLLGGLDVSPVPSSSPECAVGCLVVLSFPSLDVIFVADEEFYPSLPYIPTYLGFREAPIYLKLLEKARKAGFEPQLLLIDGFGQLHPRRCGVATHVGVLSGIPTIGIGKRMLRVDLEEGKLFKSEIHSISDVLYVMTTEAGSVDGAIAAAIVPSGSTREIFVSIGHRISLKTAVRTTLACCKYRIPEPIRLADHMSRAKARRLMPHCT